MKPLPSPFSRSVKRQPRHAASVSPCRLLLERLEDRSVPAAIAPPSGIVSWWTGDNTTADHVGPNHGTLNNGAGFAPGNVAGAFNFDGVNDYFEAATAGLPTGNADRTVELWVKLDTLPTSGEAFFAGYGVPGASGAAYGLGANSSGVFWSQWGTGIGGPVLQANRWYHVAVTNVGNSATLYLDGVAVGSNTVTINTAANTPFHIGKIPGTFGDIRKLDGSVDEVSVYNRALSATEVLAIYEAGSDGKIKNGNYFVADYVSVTEGANGSTATATFTISRYGSLSGQATVDWATADGTATAGTDYVAASGQVVFQDGESQKTVQVTVNGDDTHEGDETFRLILSNPTPGYEVAGGQATILDDDVGVYVGDATVGEGGTGYRFTDNFVAPDGYGLAASRDIRIGPDGNVYVASHDSDVVKVFEVGTGRFLRDLATSGGELDGPWGMVFGADGRLYVTGRYSLNIVRFDVASGAYDVFVPTSSGGLGGSAVLTFGPDGNLYVGNRLVGTQTIDTVKRFDGATGAYLGDFVTAGSGGLIAPTGIAFGPDGNLYVASNGTRDVKRYNGQTGAFINIFVPDTYSSGGMPGPRGLVFRGDGYLYVGADGAGQSPKVYRYNAVTGALVDVFVVSPLGTSVTSLAFTPSGELYASLGSATLQPGSAVARFAPSTWAAFTVSLSDPSAVPVSVGFSTADGTATVGSDYTAVSGTLTFAAGETTRTVLVPTLDDSTVEPAETFVLNLSAAVGAMIGDGAGVGSITDNDVTKFYVVNDASPDQTYRYGDLGNAQASTGLDGGNTAPRGAASTAAGDKLWVVDANKKVYVYSAAGSLLGSWTANSLASNAIVEDITTNGTDIWIVDAKQDKVFRYTGAASLLSGSQTAASSFKLASGNGNPKGIVTDGSSLWVVNDAGNDKVFKYTLTGSLLGSWTMHYSGSAPTGITLDPSNPAHLWIVDNATDRVYRFDNAVGLTSGIKAGYASFDLAAGNTNPQGIADPPAGPTAGQGATPSHAPRPGAGQDEPAARQESFRGGDRLAALDRALADWSGIAAEVAALERRSSRR